MHHEARVDVSHLTSREDPFEAEPFLVDRLRAGKVAWRPARSMDVWLHRLSFSLALLASVSCSACASEARPRVVLQGERGEVAITVEIAATPDKRSLGLMYRRDLAADAGMLFVFEQSEPLSFWMKNTPLPLDMIFIDEDLRIVGIVENAEPFTTTPRQVGAPSRYVLEVNAGLSKRHGVRAGSQVRFEGVPRGSGTR